MAVRATCTILFSEKDYRSYVALRDRGRLLPPSASEAEAFLRRHGAAGEPLEYQQAVRVCDEGIEIAFGMPGAHPHQMNAKLYAWSEWGRVRLTPEALFVSRAVHKGRLSDMFGFNYLLRMADRDLIDDAYLPSSAIEGMEPRALADFIRARI